MVKFQQNCNYVDAGCQPVSVGAGTGTLFATPPLRDRLGLYRRDTVRWMKFDPSSSEFRSYKCTHSVERTDFIIYVPREMGLPVAIIKSIRVEQIVRYAVDTLYPLCFRAYARGAMLSRLLFLLGPSPLSKLSQTK